MATTAQDTSNFESSLRDRLFSAQTVSQQLDDPSHAQDHETQIDPSIEGGLPPQHPNAPDDFVMSGILEQDMQVGVVAQSKAGQGKRELSTTKRAAQNRAAQRAFRQRKEAYIIKLEDQIKDFRALEDDLRVTQHENYQLREYILVLQNRILETSSELPAPPPQIHIPHPTEASAAMVPIDGQIESQQTDVSLVPGAQDDAALAGIPASMLPAPPSEPQIEDAIPREAVQQLRAAAAAGNGQFDGDNGDAHPHE